MNLEHLFRHILKPALGCTEPVAVALATAAAVQAINGWTPGSNSFLHINESDVREIEVRVSRNIFKNTFAILIPNTDGHKGILMSAALGAFCDPRRGMNLFEDLTPAIISSAETLADSGRIRISIAEDSPSDVYIDVEARLSTGSGSCTIAEEHDAIVRLKQNGRVIHGEAKLDATAPLQPDVEELRTLTFRQIIGLLDQLPDPVYELLRATIDKNNEACRVGMSQPMGIGTGYFGTGDEDGDVSTHMASLTAAGSDARMSGYPVEIMTSAGSGNQGIVATIPIVVYAKRHSVEEWRMLRALALSHLVTMYITSYVGYLSALCGVAIKAGIGAACGVTYAMGGDPDDDERAVKIMAATLTGMICDGAKAGCALKVSTAADMAYRAASLAMRRAEVPDDNGIVAPTAEQTIENLAKLSRSMGVVDEKIIEIMLAKIAH